MEEVKDKFDYRTLSLKKQYVWKLCRQIMKDLKNGDGCTDEQIEDLISKTEPRSRGYFREEDFVTADEAMKILCLGKNRNRFFSLIKVYKIEAKTFKGVKIGYRINDIYALKDKLESKNKPLSM